MPIDWNDALTVGVPVVDRQHRRIIARAAALIDAMRSRAGAPQVRSMLRFLVGYTATHFVSEEQLMMDVVYPGIEAHADEHDALRRRVRALVRAFDTAGGPSPSVAVDLNSFVCEWFFDHINKSDRALAAYLAERPRLPRSGLAAGCEDDDANAWTVKAQA